ncbi:GlxA family transcriptional regulator [Dyella sp.]|uniref:GlxA family transcriptional regulator n=1 Tax=Dyella sp. TaxID=1869338 RepID=UPI002ED37262
MPISVSLKERTIAIALFEGFQAMDVFGPLDAFDAANGLLAGSYKLELWSLQGDVVRAENGARVMADRKMRASMKADTLIIPGGCGARTLELTPAQRKALTGAARLSRRVVSVCTGAFVAGMLAEKPLRLATHWKYAGELQARYPSLQIDADVLYVHDGNLWSSAGISAAIDLSLRLIADDLGEAVSIACARQLVVHYRRSGDQAQYSEPLQLQRRNAGEFGALLAWMLANPHGDHSVAALSERSGMSTRHFTRRFAETFGESPARFAERVRLDHARTLLMQGMRIEPIARSAGFRSADAFRRAFERRFAVSPSDYRSHFAPSRTRTRTQTRKIST